MLPCSESSWPIQVASREKGMGSKSPSPAWVAATCTWPQKPKIFSEISDLNPRSIAVAKIMTATHKAVLSTARRTMSDANCPDSRVDRRLAMREATDTKAKGTRSPLR